MWEVLLKLLFVATIPSLGNGDTAGDFVAAFQSMTDANADILDKLGMIGKGTFSVLKFAGPVGQIIHAGLSVGLQQDSEELRAIQQLQSQIAHQFVAVARKIDDSVQRLHYATTMNDYQKMVGFHINALERLMNDMIQAPSARALRLITTECENGPHTPRKILRWINLIADQNCKLPTVNEAKTYARALEVTTQIKKLAQRQNRITNSSFYAMWQSELLVNLMKLPYATGNEHLGYIENALLKKQINFESLKTPHEISQRMVSFFIENRFDSYHADVHRNASADYFECFLNIVSTKYEKRRAPLLDHVNIIINDAVRVQILGVMCEGIVSTEQDDYKFHRLQIREYDRLTKNTALAMSAWVEADLDSAWPDVILSHTKLALETDRNDDISEAEFEKFALLIQQIADERGKQNFLHQIVVCPAWQEEKFFVLKCKDDLCARLYNKLGVTVAITRIDEQEEDVGNRLALSRSQIQQHRGALEKAIKNQLYALGGTGDLSQILSKSNVGQPFAFGNYLFGRSFWRSFVFIHNRMWFAKSCSIPIGLAGTMIQGMNAFDNTTEIFDDSLFTVANRYKLILLL